MMRLLATTLKDALLFVCAWTLTVSIGVVVVLVALMFAGYLPYSDRPGPGWQPIGVTARDAQMFLNWAVSFVARFAGFWGLLLFILVRILGWLGTPMVALRVIGAVMCGFVAMIIVAAAGWYIAISLVATDLTGVIASLFGVFVFPRFRGSPGAWPLAARIACATILTISFAAFASFPLWRQSNSGVQVTPETDTLIPNAP